MSPDEPLEVAFSRGPGGTQVELRGYISRELADCIDAECAVRSHELGREVHRTEVVADIMGQWAKKQLHRTSVYSSVLGGNPQARSQDGSR